MSDPPSTDIERELARLRKVVLRQGHHLDMVRERTEEGLRRIESRLGGARGRPEPSSAQVRALMELSRATRDLRRLVACSGDGARPAAGQSAAQGDAKGTAKGDDADPQSLREGLDLLEIRIANLQRSFDLRPIHSTGRPFDDRLHEVREVRRDHEAPDGIVLEELLPGYTLAGRVVRPALVVVNRHEAP